MIFNDLKDLDKAWWRCLESTTDCGFPKSRWEMPCLGLKNFCKTGFEEDWWYLQLVAYLPCIYIYRYTVQHCKCINHESKIHDLIYCIYIYKCTYLYMFIHHMYTYTSYVYIMHALCIQYVYIICTQLCIYIIYIVLYNHVYTWWYNDMCVYIYNYIIMCVYI